MKKSILVISLFSLGINILSAQDKPTSTQTVVGTTKVGTSSSANTGNSSTTQSPKKKRCCKKKGKAIIHNAPNQVQIDSIKATKTKEKFK